jgi:lipid II:glycine glycyltransferase (peptidoglycan interpeptide bridge formation enzyme)
MTVRFATQDEIKSWNKLILNNPDSGNVFQGKEFAEQKELAGWKIRYIISDEVALTVLEKKVFGFGKVWYIPKGPGVTTTSELQKLIEPLSVFAKKHRVFTIKIEPEILREQKTLSKMTALGLTKTRPIQPNFSTVIMDTHKDLKTVLADMPQKGRYAIKRAERDGVTTELVPTTDENCKIMFDLLRGTALDAGFGIRSKNYYKTYYQRYEKAGIGQLFFAKYEGEVVAGAYALAFGHKGTYKDGASIRKRTAYGASHLLQWEVIKWMKKNGVTIHDLCGAPPVASIKDETHPHYGLGVFKTSFNKEVTEYVGAYEIPVNSMKSKLWTRFFEKLVRRIYYKMHHESYY